MCRWTVFNSVGELSCRWTVSIPRSLGGLKLGFRNILLIEQSQHSLLIGALWLIVEKSDRKCFLKQNVNKGKPNVSGIYQKGGDFYMISNLMWTWL